MQMPQAEFNDFIEKGKLKSIKTGEGQNQSISQKIGKQNHEKVQKQRAQTLETAS